MTARGFSVDATDFHKAAQALEKTNMERLAGRPISKALRASANALRRNARAELKGHRKTGRMRDHIRTRFRGRGLDMVAGVRSTGSPSNLIVGGAKAHPISSDKPMPMWEGRGAWKGGKGAGITGFARAVEHPGFRADPFFARAIDKTEGTINDSVQQAADEMVAMLADALEG